MLRGKKTPKVRLATIWNSEIHINETTLSGNNVTYVKSKYTCQLLPIEKEFFNCIAHSIQEGYPKKHGTIGKKNY